MLMFGVGATPKIAARRRREDRSILDTIVSSIDRLKTQVGAADARGSPITWDDVREIERRIQNIEAFNRSGETATADGAMGVPDSFEEHVKIHVRSAGGALSSEITLPFRVQDVARCVWPRVPVDGRHHRLPQRLAPQRTA